MAAQTYPFQLGYNEHKSIGPIPFSAASIGIDNPTPFWIHFPDSGFGAWARPFTNGNMLPAPPGFGSIRVSTQDVPSGEIAAPSTSAFASGLIYQEAQAYSSGYPAGGVSKNFAFTSASRGVGSTDFVVPAQNWARGIIAYLNVTAGAGTVTMLIFNQDTADPANVFQLATSAATAVGARAQIFVYPGIAAAIGANAVIGQGVLIRATVGGGTTTFALDYDLIP